MENIINQILYVYNEKKSIQGTRKKIGCSWNRVVKVLSSNGIIINDTHKIILRLHKEGYTPEQVTETTKLNIKTVKSYLPTVRPYYGIDLSANAKRIRKCREKKKGNDEYGNNGIKKTVCGK